MDFTSLLAIVRQNNINVQAISTLVQTVAMVVLVIITIIYVRKTAEIAKQTKKQAEIGTTLLEEQRSLKRLKIKILKILSETDQSYVASPNELASLTGINIDEIEGAVITMMVEGLIELDRNFNYRLKRSM